MYEACIIIIFIIKVKILFSLNDHRISPPPKKKLTIQPRVDSDFGHVVQSLLNACLFGIILRYAPT